jgi:type I restriction enzyme, R subunit
MTRADFARKLQEIINTYNAGGSTTENYYDELMDLAKGLQSEDERHIREGLSEDELELYDLLKKEKMSKGEEQKVKLAAKSLLHRLLEEHPRVLVQDWFKDTQTKAIVRTTLEQVLHEKLPASYDRLVFKEKCDRVFDMMLQYANSGRKWAA